MDPSIRTERMLRQRLAEVSRIQHENLVQLNRLRSQAIRIRREIEGLRNVQRIAEASASASANTTQQPGGDTTRRLLWAAAPTSQQGTVAPGAAGQENPEGGENH